MDGRSRAGVSVQREAGGEVVFAVDAWFTRVSDRHFPIC
jgi:hypothetical protein